MNEISLDEFLIKLGNDTTPILDVRELWEKPKIESQSLLQIPVSQIESTLDQVPRTGELIVICQHGVRSKAVIEYLQSQHNFTNLVNLREGVSTYVK